MMKKSLFVLFLYSSLLTASEIAYRFVFGIETLPAAKMAETFALTFVIAALYLFARYKTSRLLIALFFAFSIIANNVHYAVYQSWMTGINYWLMLKEVTEVGSADASMLDKLWLPALWGVLEVMLFCSLAKFRRKTHFSADILFAFLMLMIFVRSFDTKQEHGISPKPTYSRIKANYFSFGYFVGRVLPYQLFDLSRIPAFKQPAPSKIGQGSVQNIVLIMGESESAAHLKLFGYGRETSPFLTRLSQADFQPIVKQSYSAGFMTAVSLPSFFNAIPHANGLEQISGGDTNMFRLAKEQGRHFIVLHQRGSHAPYGALLQPQDKVFGEADIVDKYDNTIHKTDQMIQTVFEQLQKQPDGNWLFAYTSDHGQYVRQDIYNQGTVQPDSYIVPLVLYSSNKAVQQAANQAFAPCEIAFHQQLSTFLIHTLGYDMPVSGCREGSVTGNLITGDAGSLNIRDGKAEYVYPQ
ncbi:TPA: phosphoethanolamine transferase [Neisseria meningitidis]